MGFICIHMYMYLHIYVISSKGMTHNKSLALPQKTCTADRFADEKSSLSHKSRATRYFFSRPKGCNFWIK